MSDLKNKIGFLKSALGSVGTYGVFGTLRLAVFEIFYEVKFRSNTLRLIDGDELAVDDRIREHGTVHLPSPFYFTRQAFKHIPADLGGRVFVDMGCGLGRVMFFASQFPFKKLIGVEVSEPLAMAARANLERYYAKERPPGPDWEVVCCNAAEFQIPDDGTVFYFGDPFDETIMGPVIENILASAQKAARQVFVLYVNPAHSNVLTTKGFRVLASEVKRNDKGFAVFSRGHPAETNEVDWDDYWNPDSHRGKWLYDLIASFYRRFIIRPAVNSFLGAHFAPGARVLHAGCGSGMVDVDMAKRIKITALDISHAGLAEYARHHDGDVTLMHGSILDIPCEDESFEGIFNLGVMEHFTTDELARILPEFNRVLKTGSRIILFWPPVWGLSVNVLKAVHFVLHNVIKSEIELHPPEYTHIRSRKETAGWLEDAGFELRDFYFGPRDFFTHRIVVAEKVRHLSGA